MIVIIILFYVLNVYKLVCSIPFIQENKKLITII